MSQALNINQFGLNPVLGMIDLTVAKRGTITVLVSENETGKVYASTPVILDSSATGPMPQVILAADSDAKALFPIFNPQFNQGAEAGAVLEVTGNLGPVIWLKAAATIAMGATVETVVASGKVQTKSGGKAFGIALLNGVTDYLLPVMIISPCGVAS